MLILKSSTSFNHRWRYPFTCQVRQFLFITLLALAFQGCQPLKRFQTTRSTPIPYGSCDVIPYAVKHELKTGDTPWQRIIDLPATGKFVEESHYLTKDENFIDKRWPKGKDDQIQAHLKRSFNAYKRYDPTVKFTDLYSQPWQKEWTPEEGGHFGQGSIGEIQRSELSVEMEMWFLTMMWAKGERPARGTKFLLTANGKNVVAIAGYETGPSRQEYLGGITREVHYWLGTSSKDAIKVQLLKNQSLPPGPLNCQ